MKSKGQGEKLRKISTTLCNLKVPDFWKNANASFYVMYTFILTENGSVGDLLKVRDDVVGEEEVKSCLSDWKLEGFPGRSNFAVTFSWHHGKGWVDQVISTKGFKLTGHTDGVGY